MERVACILADIDRRRRMRETRLIRGNGGNEEDERKIYTVYAGALRCGRFFPQPSGNGCGVPDFVHVFKRISQSPLLLDQPSGAGILLFSHVFPKLCQAV